MCPRHIKFCSTKKQLSASNTNFILHFIVYKSNSNYLNKLRNTFLTLFITLLIQTDGIIKNQSPSYRCRIFSAPLWQFQFPAFYEQILLWVRIEVPLDSVCTERSWLMGWFCYRFHHMPCYPPIYRRHEPPFGS